MIAVAVEQENGMKGFGDPLVVSGFWNVYNDVFGNYLVQ
jgi:hypothetical protein